MLKIIFGMKVRNIDRESKDGFPVSTVIHQIMENCTISEPSRDNIWPTKNILNILKELESGSIDGSSVIVDIFFTSLVII